MTAHDPAVQEAIDRARAEERERIAQAIDDAALHVLSEAESDQGASLTAAILDRAARIARAEDGAA